MKPFRVTHQRTARELLALLAATTALAGCGQGTPSHESPATGPAPAATSPPNKAKQQQPSKAPSSHQNSTKSKSSASSPTVHSACPPELKGFGGMIPSFKAETTEDAVLEVLKDPRRVPSLLADRPNLSIDEVERGFDEGSATVYLIDSQKYLRSNAVIHKDGYTLPAPPASKEVTAQTKTDPPNKSLVLFIFDKC